MDRGVLEAARQLLAEYVGRHIRMSKDKQCTVENWGFLIKHSLRVEEYAVQIAKGYPSLTAEELLTLQLAAIFHDIGNVVQREEHAKFGAEIVSKIYDESEFLLDSGADKERLILAVANHSIKEDETDKDKVSLILKDADVLDQIGAMSILMHSTKLDYHSYTFYMDIITALKGREMSFCQEQYNLLKTGAGKTILEEKIRFMKAFQEQLSSELSGELKHEALLRRFDMVSK